MSIVLFAHYLGDFAFQTSWMALNKSKQWNALILHILTYSFIMLIVMVLGVSFAPMSLNIGLYEVFGWVGLNSGIHFITDMITSRATAWATENEKRDLFWKIIGFDQFLHAVTLLVTLKYFI